MGGILGRRAWEQSNGGLWLPAVHWSPVQMGFCCCEEDESPPGSECCPYCDYEVVLTVILPECTDPKYGQYWPTGTYVLDNLCFAQPCVHRIFLNPPYNSYGIYAQIYQLDDECHIQVKVEPLLGGCYAWYRSTIGKSGEFCLCSEIDMDLPIFSGYPPWYPPWPWPSTIHVSTAA